MGAHRIITKTSHCARTMDIKSPALFSTYLTKTNKAYSDENQFLCNYEEKKNQADFFLFFFFNYFLFVCVFVLTTRKYVHTHTCVNLKCIPYDTDRFHTYITMEDNVHCNWNKIYIKSFPPCAIQIEICQPVWR